MAPSESRLSSGSTSTISVTANASRPSLTQAINAAAKPYHSNLNKSIMARLPLALPPNTEDPVIYAKGIRHMLPIYHAFESAWAKHISVEPQTPASEDLPLDDAVVLSILVHLNIPQMTRADRLRADVSSLLGQGLGEIESWVMGVSGEESLSNSVLYDERERVRPTEETMDNNDIDDGDSAILSGSSVLQSAAPEHPALRTFVRHIHYASRTKPHVLIAYAWVLYMALFNGGRWIRAQLATARESWDVRPMAPAEDSEHESENGADETGLSFWYFEGAHDGDDIKDEFKARMVDIEQMLNDQQREDIIEEAVYIFQACSRIVGELDDMDLNDVTNYEETVADYSDAEDEEQIPESDTEDSMEDSFFIRSELLRPRRDAPWRYLELVFRYLLPLGLFDLFASVARWGKRAARHIIPTLRLRWSWSDTVAVSKED